MNFITGQNTTIRGETASSPLQKRNKNITEPSKVHHEKQKTVNQFLESLGTTSAKTLKKQTKVVHVLSSLFLGKILTPDLVTNKKGDRPKVKM